MSEKKKGKKKSKKKSTTEFRPNPDMQASTIMGCKKKVLEHICTFGSIVDEVKLDIDKEKGIFIKAVDPAHICMRELHIKPGPNLAIVNPMNIGIDVDKLKNIVPLMPKEDEVAVGIQDYGNTITFAYGHHFTAYKFVDLLGLSDPKMPTLKLPGCYRADVDALMESVKHIEVISSHIKFISNDGGFVVSGLGDKDSYSGMFWGTCVDFDNTLGEGDNKSIYSIDYFDSILRAFKKMKFEEMWIQVGQDYPGIFEVEVNEGDYQFHDRFVLAPRIENE